MFSILNSSILILFCVFRLFSSLIPNNNIFIPFRTKNLRIDYENENYEYAEESHIPLNPSSFLNKWFYNGIYLNIQIGNPNQQLQTYLNFDNSYFSIEKCDKLKDNLEYSISKERFLSSRTLKINEIENDKNITVYKLCKDFFTFYDTSNYNSFIYINENYDGLNFLYNDNSNGKLCGNIGFNFNYNDNTNFIEQLKKKKIISKYIWTLDYHTLSQGVIVFGSEPHFYDSNSNFYSQYKTIYSNLGQNKNTWTIVFDRLNIEGKNIKLKYTSAELHIDHGLIIGTEEYKNFIEQNYFNELINENICFKETAKLMLKEFSIFYCDKIKFKGDFTSSSYNKLKPINRFNSLFLHHKEFEYIFKMGKEELFEEIEEKIYFLIIFDINDKNEIWKLGEPFISQHKFVFNQEQKLIGFYNPLLKKIPNSEYDLENINNKRDKSNFYNSYKINPLFNNMKNILLIIALILVIIYIIKKILAKRKKRANELFDNFEYLPNGNRKILNNSFDIN